MGRRSLSLAVALLALLAVLLHMRHAHAQGWFLGQDNSVTPIPWTELKLGGGGYVTSIDIQCDQGVGACNNSGTTTKVVRTDGSGIWWYNPATTNCGNANRTGCWQPLVTPSSMPASAQVFASAGGAGVYEVVIAPSNTNVIYFYADIDSCIYTTTNKGVNWTKTAFPCGGNNLVGGNAVFAKLFHPYMAVDPANPNIMLTGTPKNGVWITKDGGNSFNQIATGKIPFGLTSVSGAVNTGPNVDGTQMGGGNLIAFDPTSSVVGGATQGIYVSSFGNGLFHSTDGGTTWSAAISGAPTTYFDLAVDPTGIVWALDGISTAGVHPSNIHSWNGSTWTNYSEATNQARFTSIAIDTNNCATSNTCHIAFADDSGQFDLTTTGGTGATPFTGINNHRTRVATDIPWLQNTQENYMSSGRQKYDPSGSSLLWFAEGIGIWTTNPPVASSTAFNWTSVTANLENLTAKWIISPPGGNPVFSMQDRPVFAQTNLAQFPSNHGVNYNQPIVHGWHVDYAQASPSTLVLIANTGGVDTSASSSNGGTSWTQWAKLPPDIAPSNNATTGPFPSFGGAVAASTATNWCALISNNFNIWCTSNGATTAWTLPTFSGVPMALAALTNASTPTNSNVLHFANVPSAVVTAINSGKTSYTASDLSGAITNAAVSSANSTSVTLNANVAAQVNTGDSIYVRSESGWQNSGFDNHHMICADGAIANKFYAYNYGPTGTTAAVGIWESTDGGVTWSRANTTNFGGVISGRMVCPPGVSNELYLTQGSQSGAHPSSQAFYKCTDNGAGTITCSAISGVTDVWAVGFGKAKPGGSGYPAIYIYGAVNNQMGYWRSTDHTATWKQIGDAFQNTLDSPVAISGDNNTYGQVYACFSSSGCIYGQFNYLLQRDLDPAANDDAPAFLAAVA